MGASDFEMWRLAGRCGPTIVGFPGITLSSSRPELPRQPYRPKRRGEQNRREREEEGVPAELRTQEQSCSGRADRLPRGRGGGQDP